MLMNALIGAFSDSTSSKTLIQEELQKLIKNNKKLKQFCEITKKLYFENSTLFTLKTKKLIFRFHIPENIIRVQPLI